MHAIHYDTAANVMRFRMAGFWTVEDVQRFAADLLVTVGRIPERQRNFDVLSDTTDFPVQSQEVSDALARIMNVADQMNPTGRKAIVVGSMMNKLQAQRAMDHPNVRVFLSQAEADKWLALSRDGPAGADERTSA